MQIDTFKHQMMTIDEAAKHASGISRKKKNRNVILRWANRGVAGVILPTIRMGSDLFTSQEAMNWFFNESRKAKSKARSKATSEGMRRSKLTKSGIELEAQELGI